MAVSIAAANTTCILRNPHNTEVDHARRVVGCQTHNARRHAIHANLDSSIDDVRDQLFAASRTQKELKAKLQGLNERKKEAGQTPRHN